jgi:2-keto-4-pentenoate hydratase
LSFHGFSTMTAAWDDPRISRGMAAQLAHRRALLDAGQKPLGWKLAFGGPAAMERLRINAPLVGFLMHSALVPSGATLSVSGWIKPAAEPEIAVHLGKDLPANSDRAATMDAIAGLGPAIEVADVHHPSDDVEGTLACNIYQRHIILGRPDPAYAGGRLDGLSARVFRNGSVIAIINDAPAFTALTGDLIDIVRHVANLLSAFGESLAAGQVIIAGSITPPLWIAPAEEIAFHLDPIGSLSIRFAAPSL